MLLSFKSYNNAVITIPNSTITSAYVVNWNRLTSRRFDAIISISLETPVEKLRKMLNETIEINLKNNKYV